MYETLYDNVYIVRFELGPNLGEVFFYQWANGKALIGVTASPDVVELRGDSLHLTYIGPHRSKERRQTGVGSLGHALEYAMAIARALGADVESICCVPSFEHDRTGEIVFIGGAEYDVLPGGKVEMFGNMYTLKDAEELYG